MNKLGNFKKKILLIGGDGFIGQSLAVKISTDFKNQKIYVLDKKFNNWSYKKNNKNIKFIKCNINNTSKYKSILKNSDIIVDCIGSTNHNFLEQKHIEIDLKANLSDKIPLLYELQKIKKPILYISLGTLFKYGTKKKINNIENKNNIRQHDIQSINKVAFENYLKILTRQNNFLFVKILNIGSVYGYHNNKDRGLVNSLIIDFINNKTIDYFYSSNSNRYKNIIYIDNLVKEIVSHTSFVKNMNNFYEKNVLGDLINMDDLINYLKFLFPDVKINYIKKDPRTFLYYYKKRLIVSKISKKIIDESIERFQKKNYKS